MKAAPENDPWGVFDYEVDMLRGTMEICTHCAHVFSWVIQNAIFESLLLHTRILCDILLSRRKCSKGDDIILEMLLPDFRSPKIQELDKLYGESTDEGKPCWIINKRLAHPTLVRSEGYNHSPWMNQLMPVLFSLVAEIQEVKAKKKSE
jgi:hypothetical protein